MTSSASTIPAQWKARLLLHGEFVMIGGIKQLFVNCDIFSSVSPSPDDRLFARSVLIRIDQARASPSDVNILMAERTHSLK